MRIVNRIARQINRPVKPAADQPGTLHQQLGSLVLFFSDPDDDRQAAWQRSVERMMPHARREVA